VSWAGTAGVEGQEIHHKLSVRMGTVCIDQHRLMTRVDDSDFGSSYQRPDQHAGRAWEQHQAVMKMGQWLAFGGQGLYAYVVRIYFLSSLHRDQSPRRRI
jgi:hypothetical protein